MSAHAAPWRFSAPHSVLELERLLLAGDGCCVLIAGGQSVLPGLLAGKRQPAHLIDITKIDELRRIEVRSGSTRMGAAVTLTEILESIVATSHSCLARALSYVGTRPIRNRATVGGSLAWADPRAELRLILLALRGAIHTNRRTVPAADFIKGVDQKELLNNEVILGVELPEQGSLNFGEMLDRNSAGRAVVLVAVETKVAMIRITVGGLADRPVTSPWVQRASALNWLKSVTAEYPPLHDPFHSLHYRLAVAGVLVERTLGTGQ